VILELVGKNSRQQLSFLLLVITYWFLLYSCHGQLFFDGWLDGFSLYLLLYYFFSINEKFDSFFAFGYSDVNPECLC